MEYSQSEFGNTTQNVVVNGSTGSVRLSGLEEYVVYSIRVRAATIGYGPYSDAITERTLEDGKVTYNPIV